MNKSTEVSTEALKQKLVTFSRFISDSDVWTLVDPVGHASADAAGFVVELSLVRLKGTPEYLAVLTAAKAPGEMPLSTLDLRFDLESVRPNDEVLYSISDSLAREPGVLAELLAKAFEAEHGVRHNWSLPN